MQPTPKKKSLAGKLFRSSMMGVRRVHLYSGIFMFPFVLMYGFSGWFFNHPGILVGDQVTTLSAEVLNVPTLPSADQTTAAVIDEMNLESFAIGGPEVTLDNSESARYTEILTFSLSAKTQTHLVTINPHTGRGQVRTTFVEPKTEDEPKPKPNPLAGITHVQVPETAVSEIRAAIPAAIDSLGLESDGKLELKRTPSLDFRVTVDGVPCIVKFNPANGAITSKRVDEEVTVGKKRFLERLHLARRYTPQFDVRWVWALLVDAMFVSMVFWGCSGLFMWWQVKRTRVLGAGLLAASIVFTAVMAAGMHDDLTDPAPGKAKPAPTVTAKP